MSRRVLDRRARERHIVDCARALAEEEGWAGVTTRRLSVLIGYSQPVIYHCFATMDDVMATAAIEGFAELAVALRQPRRRTDLTGQVARNYLAFAAASPALYEAMFNRTGGFEFGRGTSNGPLFDTFAVLLEASQGDETAAELLWATLHGLASLQSSGRIRAGSGPARMIALSSQLDRTVV